MTGRRSTWLWIATAACLLASACVVTNDSCPVTSPEIWGELSVALNLNQTLVSQCETAVGNFLADALLGYEYGLGETIQVRVALVDPDVISDEVRCGERTEKRETLPKGVVTDQDVAQLLPTEDEVVVVRMSGAELKQVMERAVSWMKPGGKTSAQTLLLQFGSERIGDTASFAGNLVMVDCSGVPQELNVDGTDILIPGSRIVQIRVGNSVIDSENLTGTFYVATLASLVSRDAQDKPTKGFVAFHQAEVEVFHSHVSLNDAVHNWLQIYTADPFYPGSEYPQAEGRLDLQNCLAEPACTVP